MKYTYKEKEYEVLVGARGGKYFIDDKGKKHYLKSDNPKPRKKKEEKKPVVERKLMDYTVWINVRNDDYELINDFKEWTPAYSEEEALEYFRDEHPDRPGRHYEIDIFKIEPHEN